MLSRSWCLYIFIYFLLVRNARSDMNVNSEENIIVNKIINLKVKEHVTSVIELLKNFLRNEYKVLTKSDTFRSIKHYFNIDKIWRFLKDYVYQNVGEVTEDRKMKISKNAEKFIPFLLVPGLLLTGILPWIVPKLKMIVMAVGFINQIAFSTALFSFIRGYIFDRTEKEHVFYINHGYKHKHNKHNPINYHR
ncbi:hypothetical protein RN001_006365 [Aquatica leii]|uniref:Uncharacterized protein n=1 Tax=Aquatica leii TaxID=1421715 RepID=A0AAN7PIG6_9COLE|nr:hypothetical protein RN001_006365 [Aquatica leii]